MKKARPAIGKIGHELLDQLSTKVRPNKRYKIDRAELDGAGFDIHSAIGKLPAPKKGWTLPGHIYTGPYNPLEQQLKYNLETGEIIEIYQRPTGSTDAVSMQHDVDYRSCAFRRKRYGENEKNANTPHTVKWLTLLIPFRGIEDNGDMHSRRMLSIQNKNLDWGKKNKTVSFLPIHTHKKSGQDRLFVFSEQLENCVVPFFSFQNVNCLEQPEIKHFVALFCFFQCGV